MSLLVAEDVCLRLGGVEILEKVSFRVAEGDRIGLLGPNGSGKSTLLKVMAGGQVLDSGEMRRSKGCRVGYLPQDILDLPKGPLLQTVLDSVPGRAEVTRGLAETEDRLARCSDPEEQMALAGTLADLHERLEHINLYHSPDKAMKILKGLGFKEKDFTRPLAEFSGGWKMRSALAGLLLQNPDVLLLDEPTNHLDLPTVQWFQEFLLEYDKAMVLVSHDREFLNPQVSRIMSFEPDGFRTFEGNYDVFVLLREELQASAEARARNQDRERRELERFVERFKAKASKARQAQSRVKMIARMEKGMDSDTVPMRRTLRFTMPISRPSAREVVRIEDLCKSFGDNRLYQGLTLKVQRGERIAVVGVNGAGKTTLMKILAGELQHDSGQVVLGQDVDLGYYAQHHSEMLETRSTVLDEVWRMAPSASQTFIRGVCGAFLFSGDDVFKAVGVLSGGEKARVALARILVKPCNLLIMDEPTNHLDLESAEALADALKAYEGTLIFVSHNQSFVNHLSTKVWDLSDRKVEEYPGNLDRYLEHLAAVRAMQPVESFHEERRNRGKRGDPAKEQRRAEERLRLDRERQVKTLRKRVGSLEGRIEELESQREQLEGRLAEPSLFQQMEAYQEVVGEHKAVNQELEGLMAQWERVQQELEGLEE